MQKTIPRLISILLFLCVSSLNYAASCSNVSVSTLTFTTVTSGSGTQSQPVTISYTCTGAITISISSGTPYSSGDRQLFIGGTGTGIPYTVKDNLTNLWGDGINTAALGNVFSTTGSGSPASQTATFTINVPSGVLSGTYTNSLDIQFFDGATLLASTTINPVLTIVDSCTISSTPTPVYFGTFAAGSSSSIAPQSASIGITCGNGVSYYWGADFGGNWGSAGCAVNSRCLYGANYGGYIAYKLEEGSPLALLGDSNLPTPYTPTTNILGRFDTANGFEKIYSITATVTENPLPSAVDAYSDIVNYTVVW